MRRTSSPLVLAAFALVTFPALADIFQDELDQVDYALKNNPTHALKLSLESCLKQRHSAVKLNKMGDEVRARRALQYCFDSLNLSPDL